MQPIVIKSSCIGCGACRTVCKDTHAILMSKGPKGVYQASVVENKCTQCGDCVAVCQHESAVYNDDLTTFVTNLEDKAGMTIIVSPEIQVLYPYWKGLLKHLQDSGCKVYDATYGVDINIWAHMQLNEQNPDKKYINTHCPVVLQNICKYHPDLLSFVAPVMSPESCLGVFMKKYRKVSEPIYLLTVCPSKTYEKEKFQTFDYVVSIPRLLSYFNTKGISAKFQTSSDFVFNNGVSGKLPFVYTRPNGFEEVFDALGVSGAVYTCVKDIYEMLDTFTSSSFQKRFSFTDLSHCGGCGYSKFIGSMQVNAVDMAHDSFYTMPSASVLKKYFKDFKTYNLNDFMYTVEPDIITPLLPSKSQLETIFQSLNKSSEQSRCVDCGMCGFGTCRDFAISVYRKESLIEDCIPYLKRRVHSLEKGSKSGESRSDVHLPLDISVHIRQLRLILTTLQESADLKKSLELVKNLKSALNNIISESPDVSEEDNTIKLLNMILKVLATVETLLTDASGTDVSSVFSLVDALEKDLSPYISLEESR